MCERSGYTLKSIMERKKIKLEMQYLRLMLIVAAIDKGIVMENGSTIMTR